MAPQATSVASGRSGRVRRNTAPAHIRKIQMTLPVGQRIRDFLTMRYINSLLLYFTLLIND